MQFSLYPHYYLSNPSVRYVFPTDRITGLDNWNRATMLTVSIHIAFSIQFQDSHKATSDLSQQYLVGVPLLPARSTVHCAVTTIIQSMV